MKQSEGGAPSLPTACPLPVPSEGLELAYPAGQPGPRDPQGQRFTQERVAASSRALSITQGHTQRPLCMQQAELH